MGFITKLINSFIRIIGKIRAVVIFRGAKKIGRKVIAKRGLHVLNSKYISIADKCFFGPNCRIEAWDLYNKKRFSPEIIFGEDVRINSTCHIGAINRVVIGSQTLLGSHVMIIDHSHGKNSIDEIQIHPSDRDLYSKGEVVIGEKCWIGENAVILPNVHIGNGTIIGANSVVTKDIPAYSVAAGNPAKVVKKIKE